jgi:hypothetical protein
MNILNNIQVSDFPNTSSYCHLVSDSSAWFTQLLQKFWPYLHQLAVSTQPDNINQMISCGTTWQAGFISLTAPVLIR